MAPLSVTPMSLSEVVKMLMDEPAQKERITTLQQGYAQGKVSKDEFTILLGQICGQETMTKALEDMQSVYNEEKRLQAIIHAATMAKAQEELQEIHDQEKAAALQALNDVPTQPWEMEAQSHL